MVKRTLESKTLVPGGGACEAALSIYLETFATSLGSREQLAIAEYAKSLLVIPKTLAVNAGKGWWGGPTERYGSTERYRAKTKGACIVRGRIKRYGLTNWF